MSDVSWGTKSASWPEVVQMMKSVKRFRKEGFYLLVDEPFEKANTFRVTLMGPSLTRRAKIEKEISDLENQRANIEFVIELLRHDLSLLPAKKGSTHANKKRISD